MPERPLYRGGLRVSPEISAYVCTVARFRSRTG